MNTGSQYLDIDEPERIPLPPVPEGKGVILSGRIPHWLLVAVCQHLTPTQAWLAVYQPAPLNAALVVASQSADYRVGQLIPYQSGN
jgi:CRISPR-associated protein Csx3